MEETLDGRFSEMLKSLKFLSACSALFEELDIPLRISIAAREDQSAVDNLSFSMTLSEYERANKRLKHVLPPTN